MTGSSLRHRIDSALRFAIGRERGSRSRRASRPLAAHIQASEETAPTAAELDLESRVVWMLGSPRTGSTWLLRLLIHPWILAKESPTGLRRPLALRRRSGPDVVPLDESFLLRHLVPLQMPPYRQGRSEDPAEFTIGAVKATEPAYFFHESFEPGWRPALRRLILARLGIQAALAVSEHSLTDPLVLVKEPNGSHGAELLMRTMPQSRLLFLLRDGRDVVDSALDALRSGSWGASSGEGVAAEDAAARRAFVLNQARLWTASTTAVQRAYKAHPPERRLMVRYEALRSDTESELRRIWDWLGMARSEAQIRAAVEANAFEAIPGFLKGPGTPRRAASPGLWRENLSAEEQAAMTEVMGAKLAELGYDPD